MNTALLFTTAAALTVTGAASLPFVMHRLEGALAGRDESPTPAQTPAATAPAPAPGLAGADAA